jgi:beta-1,4-N-acetylglucosaminyltransferase
MAPYVFVTVGTTSFDALVDSVMSAPFADAVRLAGFDQVLVQYGRVRIACAPAGSDAWDAMLHGMRFSFYGLKPSIAADIAGAGLVVSHAGAGSIFESLRAGRPLAVVINTSLADNHQTELAHAMSARGHCVHCFPDGVAASIPLALQTAARVPLPPRDLSAFVSSLERLLAGPC